MNAYHGCALWNAIKLVTAIESQQAGPKGQQAPAAQQGGQGAALARCAIVGGECCSPGSASRAASACRVGRGRVGGGAS